MASFLLRFAVVSAAILAANAQFRLVQDDGRTSNLGLSFPSGGCLANPCVLATSNLPHVDGWPDSTALVGLVPDSVVEALIEPVGHNLTTRVECSAGGITAAAGAGKYFLVTSFEPGCTPTQIAQFAASNGAAGVIVAAPFCLSGFAIDPSIPQAFKDDCSANYDTGPFSRGDIESSVFLDHQAVVQVPVVIVSRYEAYFLRECIEGSATFTLAQCAASTPLLARLQWNLPGKFGNTLELWDSFANDRNVPNLFNNEYLDLVYPDLLLLNFKPEFFIEAGVCGGGSCTLECSSGHCTRNLSPTYDMAGGDAVLEEMRRRFCMWETLKSGDDERRLSWLAYINAVERICYAAGPSAVEACAGSFEQLFAQVNVSTSLNCELTLGVFLTTMDSPKRQNVPGGERALVFNDKIIYRDTDQGNNLAEFNTIMATICQPFGADTNFPAIFGACTCRTQLDPIPDFGTFNDCFESVVITSAPTPAPQDDSAVVAVVGSLAAVGILLSAFAVYRTRNYKKITDEEKMFTREEALKMAQEFAHQLMKEEKGEVGPVKEEGLFDKELEKPEPPVKGVPVYAL